MTSDLVVSLVVVIATALLVAGLFVILKSRDRIREEEIVRYCEQQGYHYNKEMLPMGTKISIVADSWQLTSELQTQRNETSTGSNTVSKNTIWCSKTLSRPAFILGSTPSAANFDSLPDWMKTAALQKITTEFGVTVGTDTPYVAISLNGTYYLLFSYEMENSQGKVRENEEMLTGVASSRQVLIRCGQEGVVIDLRGIFLRDVSTLENLIKLGLAYIS